MVLTVASNLTSISNVTPPFPTIGSTYHVHFFNSHRDIISPIRFKCNLPSFRFIRHPLNPLCLSPEMNPLKPFGVTTPTPDKTGALMDSVIDSQFSSTVIKGIITSWLGSSNPIINWRKFSGSTKDSCLKEFSGSLSLDSVMALLRTGLTNRTSFTGSFVTYTQIRYRNFLKRVKISTTGLTFPYFSSLLPDTTT